MLEAETIQGATLAAAGDVQALMNQLGLAARSAATAKLQFEPDLRASLRRGLQFGRGELVSLEAPITTRGGGALTEPCDVIVAGRTRTPQLAVEIGWHPRGEDHPGFCLPVIHDIVKMALAQSKKAVEQTAVLVAAPARFWRWLPGYSEDHLGFGLLCPEDGTPASAKSDFLADRSWDRLFDEGLDGELPERIWTSLLCDEEVRSPWSEVTLHLLEVKGLGSLVPVRAGAG